MTCPFLSPGVKQAPLCVCLTLWSLFMKTQFNKSPQARHKTRIRLHGEIWLLWRELEPLPGVVYSTPMA